MGLRTHSATNSLEKDTCQSCSKGADLYNFEIIRHLNFCRKILYQLSELNILTLVSYLCEFLQLAFLNIGLLKPPMFGAHPVKSSIDLFTWRNNFPLFYLKTQLNESIKLKIWVECKSQLEGFKPSTLFLFQETFIHTGCCRKFSPYSEKLYYSAERNSRFMVRQNLTKCNQYAMHPGEHRLGLLIFFLNW